MIDRSFWKVGQEIEYENNMYRIEQVNDDGSFLCLLSRILPTIELSIEEIQKSYYTSDHDLKREYYDKQGSKLFDIKERHDNYIQYHFPDLEIEKEREIFLHNNTH